MWNLHQLTFFFFFLFPFLIFSPPPPAGAVEFLFNGFHTSDLLLYGDSYLDSAPGRRFLAITNTSDFSIGRALYNSTVRMKAPNSTQVLPFASSFVFSIAPISGTLPGHGIALLFSPMSGTRGSTAAQHLGLFNRTTDGDPSNGVVAVEFDVFENAEFHDIDKNHVGVNVFSLTSKADHTAGYWPEQSPSDFVHLTLNDGSNYQAWVEYSNGKLNVTMAPATLGRKPRRPLISLDIDLSAIFQEEMYIGFCAATGKLIENHRILGWSFSNSNLSLSDALVTSNLPNFIPEVTSSKSSRSKALIAGVATALAAALVVSFVVCLFVYRRRRKRRWKRDIAGDEGVPDEAPTENWELEYWPHRIGYKEILSATDGFAERNLIGCGGNGRVYKGIIGGGTVAVKQFARNTGEEGREFLAEVSSLGRLQHRNLVGLKGWCRKAGGDLILVYEYMENGSLDRRIFPEEAALGEGVKEKCPPLDWATRVRILKDVAAGVLYLHEGWESRVLHRDIKASNVMLDGDMVGRLGDFGLARIHPHGGTPRTTRVVGTVGYMAPEVMRNGKATAATDVFGYGVLVLEVVCGRRPVLEGYTPLIEWAWEMAEKGEMGLAVDSRVKGTTGFDEEEAGRMLRMGLWCTCAKPGRRPTMRQVVRALDGGTMSGLGWADDGSGDDGGDVLGESAEAYLLEKLRTATPPPPWSSNMQCCYRGALGIDPHHRHPTFDNLKLSSSTSLSESDIITEGR